MVEAVLARSVLNRHRGRDERFLDNYTLNPYYGCCFNRIYCYTKDGRYGGSRRGLAVKVNAPRVLLRSYVKSYTLHVEQYNT